MYLNVDHEDIWASLDTPFEITMEYLKRNQGNIKLAYETALNELGSPWVKEHNQKRSGYDYFTLDFKPNKRLLYIGDYLVEDFISN